MPIAKDCHEIVERRDPNDRGRSQPRVREKFPRLSEVVRISDENTADDEGRGEKGGEAARRLSLFRQCTPSSHRGNSSILEDSKRAFNVDRRREKLSGRKTASGAFVFNAGDRKSDQVLIRPEDRRPKRLFNNGAHTDDIRGFGSRQDQDSRFFGQTLPERQDPVEGHPVTFGGGS
jgi:hypothetical protein